MVIKEEIKTEIKKEYDVAVCGGGFAGISAALAAARQGSRVVLFEKQYILGGLGTAGIVTIYLPLCDGFGRPLHLGKRNNVGHYACYTLLCSDRSGGRNCGIYDR